MIKSCLLRFCLRNIERIQGLRLALSPDNTRRSFDALDPSSLELFTTASSRWEGPRSRKEIPSIIHVVECGLLNSNSKNARKQIEVV